MLGVHWCLMKDGGRVCIDKWRNARQWGWLMRCGGVDWWDVELESGSYCLLVLLLYNFTNKLQRTSSTYSNIISQTNYRRLQAITLNKCTSDFCVRWYLLKLCGWRNIKLPKRLVINKWGWYKVALTLRDQNQQLHWPSISCQAKCSWVTVIQRKVLLLGQE